MNILPQPKTYEELLNILKTQCVCIQCHMNTMGDAVYIRTKYAREQRFGDLICQLCVGPTTSEVYTRIEDPEAWLYRQGIYFIKGTHLQGGVMVGISEGAKDQLSGRLKHPDQQDYLICTISNQEDAMMHLVHLKYQAKMGRAQQRPQPRFGASAPGRVTSGFGYPAGTPMLNTWMAEPTSAPKINQ